MKHLRLAVISLVALLAVIQEAGAQTMGARGNHHGTVTDPSARRDTHQNNAESLPGTGYTLD
jgi:hypothetical protein